MSLARPLLDRVRQVPLPLWAIALILCVWVYAFVGLMLDDAEHFAMTGGAAVGACDTIVDPATFGQGDTLFVAARGDTIWLITWRTDEDGARVPIYTRLTPSMYPGRRLTCKHLTTAHSPMTSSYR